MIVFSHLMTQKEQQSDAQFDRSSKI